MRDRLLRFRQRIEDICLEHGLAYPWWVPAVSHVATIVCVLLSLGVRGDLWPVGLPYLAIVLVSVPVVLDLWLLRWLPWYLDIAGGIIVAVWLMNAQPVHGNLDLVPSLLMFLTAETTARDGIRLGAATGSISAAVIIEAALATGGHNVAVELLGVLLGYVVGAMLRWQMRALVAEREARQQAWQSATAAERQRIAREIHDLVAHSLSVTLLQVTGARHVLGDITEGSVTETLAEADLALADAERVGRQAMADIRRTVSTLAAGPSPMAPLPGACEIADLVDQFRRAGLEVDYDESGDLAGVEGPVGLGLFRIAQESLSNAAKHGAGPVTARLQVDADRAVLEVSNVGRAGPKARMETKADSLGSGLAGMKARAEDLGAALSAGPTANGWRVEVVVPLGAKRALFAHCPVVNLVTQPGQTSPAT